MLWFKVSVTERMVVDSVMRRIEASDATKTCDVQTTNKQQLQQHNKNTLMCVRLHRSSQKPTTLGRTPADRISSIVPSACLREEHKRKRARQQWSNTEQRGAWRNFYRYPQRERDRGRTETATTMELQPSRLQLSGTTSPRTKQFYFYLSRSIAKSGPCVVNTSTGRKENVASGEWRHVCLHPSH